MKETLLKTFKNSSKTYTQHALIQQKMQDILLQKFKSYTNTSHFQEILELGCGIGLFSHKIANHFSFKHFIALDIVDFSEYFNQTSIEFHSVDIEDFKRIKNFYQDIKNDLIVSNAVLQWINQESFFQHLPSIANTNCYLLIGVFGEKNFLEFQELFGISLNYLNPQKYQKILEKDWNILEITQSLETLTFKTPLDVFKHIKNTGTNALHSIQITKNHLKHYALKFENKLTYSPLYILAQKK
ncbi:methyltransferase [Helicobacter mesocricetorum]|uniref:methyltransferase n=1 Tax=Helicobacter mesocricetorum TaxID=87012 RepID=UPI000CF11026|nr:methyltransferase [Helicobacter mesocricetorum]